LGAVLLPPVLAAFRASHPSVRLELIASGNSANLRQRVATGELDLAITVLPASVEPGVRVAATGAQRFVVVAPEDLRLGAKQGKLDRRRLVGVPVVTLAAGEGLRQQLDAIYRELGSEPEISIETTEREMLVPLVAAGLGITVVPEGFARQRSVTGLRIYDLVPPVERSFGAFVADTDVPALVSAFIAALVGSGELRASGARRSRRPPRAR
jgi:DNA-binding transcriptional LysR family regulator